MRTCWKMKPEVAGSFLAATPGVECSAAMQARATRQSWGHGSAGSLRPELCPSPLQCEASWGCQLARRGHWSPDPREGGRVPCLFICATDRTAMARLPRYLQSSKTIDTRISSVLGSVAELGEVGTTYDSPGGVPSVCARLGKAMRGPMECNVVGHQGGRERTADAPEATGPLTLFLLPVSHHQTLSPHWPPFPIRTHT